MKTPKISVIMAEYNTKPEHLKDSIKSILNQSFTDFEFIIVNDGSHTNLQDIVKGLGGDSRIRIVNNPENKGLVYSLNNAINHSKGDYLVRMDTDDIALKNRIETLYNFALSHPEYSVIGSTAIEFSSTKEKGILGKPGIKSSKDLMTGNVPIHPSVIMKKSDILEVGGYPDFDRAEDLALWCELLLSEKKIYTIDRSLLKYRVEDVDYNKRTLRKRKGEIKARLHYYPKLNAGPVEYLYIAKSIIAGLTPARLVRAYRNISLRKQSQ